MSVLSIGGACSVLRARDPSPLHLPEAFEVCFDGLAAEGMLGDLPRSAAEVPRARVTPAYEAALRKRLQRLGYLSAFAAKPSVLDAAIRKFQGEAGLVVDGWMGARTWEALQALFTFETPFSPAAWFDARGRLRPALRRAIRVRLTAYGQWSGAEEGSPPTLAQSFSNWLRQARAMGFEVEATGHSGETITPARVARLFDHEALVDHLTADPARCDPRTYGALAGSVRHTLLSLAKVELWLTGYAVAPDGKTALSVQRTTFQNRGGRRRRRRQRVVSDTAFFEVVERFLEDTKEDDHEDARPGIRLLQVNEDDRLDHAIAAILLRTRRMRLASAADRGAAMSDDELARLVMDSPQPKKFWKQITATVKSLATSLFDGAKRVWRWLRKRIGKVGTWARESLVNLARAMWHRLTAVGRILRDAFEAFVEGVRFFVKPVLPISESGVLVMAHDLDFDFKVHLTDPPDPSRLEPKLTQLRRLTLAFKIACELIGIAVAAVRGALRGTTGIGLIFVASSLIRIGRDLEALGEMLTQYRRLSAVEPMGQRAGLIRFFGRDGEVERKAQARAYRLAADR